KLSCRANNGGAARTPLAPREPTPRRGKRLLSACQFEHSTRLATHRRRVGDAIRTAVVETSTLSHADMSALAIGATDKYSVPFAIGEISFALRQSPAVIARSEQHTCQNALPIGKAGRP